MRVYLAGPDVFLPEPRARGEAMKRICARYGLCGIFPLDAVPQPPSSWTALPEARRIALCNEMHITTSHALIANLTPFRGPSADVGTVFELGFMRALGRPVFGWTNVATPFAQRTRALVQADDGMSIEDFGLLDNLMIEGAILASGGALIAQDVAAAELWRDLSAFERCVAAVAAVFR